MVGSASRSHSSACRSVMVRAGIRCAPRVRAARVRRRSSSLAPPRGRLHRDSGRRRAAHRVTQVCAIAVSTSRTITRAATTANAHGGPLIQFPFADAGARRSAPGIPALVLRVRDRRLSRGRRVSRPRVGCRVRSGGWPGARRGSRSAAWFGWAVVVWRAVLSSFGLALLRRSVVLGSVLGAGGSARGTPAPRPGCFTARRALPWMHAVCAARRFLGLLVISELLGRGRLFRRYQRSDAELSRMDGTACTICGTPIHGGVKPNDTARLFFQAGSTACFRSEFEESPRPRRALSRCQPAWTRRFAIEWA